MIRRYRISDAERAQGLFGLVEAPTRARAYLQHEDGLPNMLAVYDQPPSPACQRARVLGVLDEDLPAMPSTPRGLKHLEVPYDRFLHGHLGMGLLRPTAHLFVDLPSSEAQATPRFFETAARKGYRGAASLQKDSRSLVFLDTDGGLAALNAVNGAYWDRLFGDVKEDLSAFGLAPLETQTI